MSGEEQAAPVQGVEMVDLLKSFAQTSPVAAALAFVGWLFVGQMDSMNQELDGLRSAIHALELAQASDRWTASDQRVYATQVQDQIAVLRARVATLEDR